MYDFKIFVFNIYNMQVYIKIKIIQKFSNSYKICLNDNKTKTFKVYKLS